MLYKFDKHNLRFVRINYANIATRIIILLLIVMTALSSSVHSNRRMSESEMLVIVAEKNKFDTEKLVDMIERLHFTFPHIVYAQSLLETNKFTSNIFVENHNLFGMKKATVRINTARGEQYEHAYYSHWTESVYDYALYSATYLSSLKTEDEYFSYLGQFYAEDKQYVDKLKSIIIQEELKSKFK